MHAGVLQRMHECCSAEHIDGLPVYGCGQCQSWSLRSGPLSYTATHILLLISHACYYISLLFAYFYIILLFQYVSIHFMQGRDPPE
mgnify:CR=1 FL=1